MSTQSIGDLLASVGVKKEVYPPPPGQDADGLALNLAWVFLGCYAVKTGLSVCVCEKAASAVAAIFKEQGIVVPPGTLSKPDYRKNNKLTGLLSDIQILNAVNVTGFHSVAWSCVCMAVSAMPSNPDAKYSEVVSYLSRPVEDDPPMMWSDGSLAKLMTIKHLIVINTNVGAIMCGRASACKAFMAAHSQDVKPLLLIVPSTIFRGPASPIIEMEFSNTWYHLWISGSEWNPLKEINVIGTKNQLDRMHSVLRETYLGPKEENYSTNDWPEDYERLPSGVCAAFAAERDYLLPKLSDVNAGIKKLAEDDSYAFEEQNGVTNIELGDPKTLFRIEHHQSLFRLYEKDELIAVFDGEFMVLRQLLSNEPGVLVRVPSFSEERARLEREATAPSVSFVLKPQAPGNSALAAPHKFVPPVFGVTSLGSYTTIHSHHLATGFLLWVNGSCIVVDPPPFCDKILEYNHISVKHIILTHLHVNFHEGVHPLLLGKERVTLYTTETVMNAYMRCMKAAIGRDYLDHCDWKSLKVGVPVSICGALFVFDYALHTIPALSFRVMYGGRTISFTGANMYNPMIIAKMFQDGVITARRRETLLHSPFDADMMLCNVANNELPHTSLSTMDLLPKHIKDRIVLLNYGDRSLTPEECAKRGLHLMQAGLENTRSVQLSDFEMGRATTIKLLRLFCTNPLSKKLPADMLPSIIDGFVRRSFVDGDVIMGDGMDENNSMVCMVSKGSALLFADGEQLSEMRSGDIFAYFEDSHTRVVAKSDLEVYMCSRSVLTGRHGQDLIQAVKMHAFVQASLTKSRVFGTLEPSQLSVVASCVSEVVHFAKDEKIIRQGDTTDKTMFIVHSGTVRVEVSSQSLPHPLEFARLGPGSIVGEMAFLLHQPRSADVIACVPTTVLRIREDDLNTTLMMFPNIRFLLTTLASSRIDDAPVTISSKRPGVTVAPSPHGSTGASVPPVALSSMANNSSLLAPPPIAAASPRSPSGSRANAKQQNSGFACPVAPTRRTHKK